MSSKKTLIAGFVGTRPAVIYAALVPLLEDITENGTIDLLLAATKGGKDTQKFVPRLQKLAPLSDLNWLDLSFEVKDSEIAIAKIIETIPDYDKVYIFLKGGMGIWIDQLLFTLRKMNNTPQELFFITSNGKEAILTDSSLTPIARRPLSSLGLANYLTLFNLDADGTKVGETLQAGTLRRVAQKTAELPFMELIENKGFLYVSIWANEWLPKSNEERSDYQKAFRLCLATCRELGVEHGRAMLVVRANVAKSSALQKRALQEGVYVKAVTFANQLEMRQTIQLLKLELDKMAEIANPRDFLKVKHKTPRKIETRGLNDKKFFCETLVMTTSGTDSYVNLLAIASHRPKRVILFYDADSNDTRVAATRLQQMLMNDDTLGCEQAILLEADRMGWDIAQSFAEYRSQFDGTWDIHLTPGTKDHSFALLLATDPSDRLWVSDSSRSSMCRLDVPDECIAWQFPKLCHIASHLGGELLDTGTVIKQEMLTDANRKAVQAVFSYLTKIKNKKPLSAFYNGAIFDDQGTLNIKATGQQFQLNELFPWFKFHDLKGNHDPNLWLEVFTACGLLAAGADEVVCGIKWQWNKQMGSTFHKDELDVAVRFGNTLSVVSCKTSISKGEKKEENFWEIDYIANHFFGRFAKPLLAAPVFVHPGSECVFSQGGAKKERIGCKTRLLGVNQLASPKTLKKFIVG